MIASKAPPPKVTRPVLRGSLPRDRLYRVLDETRDRPVVWVSGPPGCGKTTLISGYIESHRLPCLWYHVDEGDADIASFFRYMRLAAGQFAPGKRNPLPSPGPASAARASPFVRRYFADLFKQIGSPSVLVFDDWQNAGPRSPLDETVREGISLLPEGVRAVFISWSDPPPDFVREVDHRRLETIGWKELRLTLEETKGIARIQRKDPSDELVRYLHGRTGGWATGVLLLLEKAHLDGIEPQRIGKQTPREIMDYLGGRQFELLDGDTRAFLVKTSFLPRITAKAAETLTGNPRAGRILSHLNRNNLFTELHPGDEPIYEYHSLFREFLLQRADELLSPEETCAARHRTAALLEATGQTEDAVELMRGCGDFRGMCRVIRKEARSLVGQGRSRMLADWLASLPENVRADDPWLLYWGGVSNLAIDPAASLPAFERALDLFSRTGDEAGTLLSWAGAVDAILCRWNDFAPLDRWIDWLDRRTAEGISFPSAEIEARVSSSMAGALLYRRPDHPELRTWSNRALAASRASGDENVRLQALHTASGIQYWTGDRAAASLATEEIRALSRSPAVSPANSITGKWIEAQTLLWSDADPDAAMRIVSEGLDASMLHGLHLRDHFFFAAGAFAAMLKGDEKAAREFLEKMESAIPAGRVFARCQLDVLCAWNHLLRDDAVGAAAHAERALAQAERSGTVFAAILCRILLANIACHRMEHAEAKVFLSGARDLIGASGSRMLEFMASLTGSRIAFLAGDEPEGLASLRAGMELGRKQGYVNMFWWWEPAVMTRLCMKALDAGIETTYAIDLMRRRNLSPEVPPMEIEEFPWKFRVYTLGRFGVVRDGKRIGFAGKAQQKPLQLLKALIALGGRDVPREMLADILWPDSDGDLALQSLAVTVRRLRKLLGDEKAIHITEGRITLSNRLCWVDCWAFKRIFSRAERARREGAASLNSSLVLLEKALLLYRGDFLEEEKESPWCVSLRERLRGKFLRAVMESGRSHEAAGEWEKALSCYRKGKEADGLHEEFYGRIMICHYRLGRPDEAIATYHRYRRTLKAVLGASPSPGIEMVFSSIRKSTEKSP